MAVPEAELVERMLGDEGQEFHETQAVRPYGSA